jgi:thymidylate synthase (FAD)
MSEDLTKNITWDDVKNDPNAVRISEHGFVVLKETMGSDDTIAESARVSYGDGTKKVSSNRGLIRYLINHDHTSPIEMGEARWLVKLPLFVSNQWVRHRTASLNQMSGRYSIMPDEFFIPEILNYQASNNKQGRDATVDSNISARWLDGYEKLIHDARDHYNDALKDDISREQARIGLPLSQMTVMYWKCDLHNTMHFLKLRMDPHAQKEIRDYAQAMYNLLKPKFPLCMEAFDDYKLHAKKFSRMEVNLLKSILTPTFYNVHIEQKAKELGLTQREIVEFLNKLQ